MSKGDLQLYSVTGYGIPAMSGSVTDIEQHWLFPGLLRLVHSQPSYAHMAI